MNTTTANGSLAVKEMDHGELKDRLLYLHRNGRLVPYPHAKVMGLAHRLKIGRLAANDLSTVRRLIADARYDSSDPVSLIDAGDSPADDELAKNYAEF